MVIFFLACAGLQIDKTCTDCEDTGDSTNSWTHAFDTSEQTVDTTDTNDSVDTTDTTDTIDTTDSTDTTDTTIRENICTWDIYDRARDYAIAHPLRDGSSWSGWCASLMWRFGDMPESSARASALIAYNDSNIVSLDYRTAPIGAFHWWDIGVYGHVGVDILGGGGTVFMASGHVLEDWGTDIGVHSVAKYGNATRATYLGWSMDYAGSTIDGGGTGICDLESEFPGAGTVPVTITERTGTPNTTFYMRMQLWASLHGYSGPVDGVLGPNSWAGFQRALASEGYNVQDSGTPDSATYSAMQSIAAQYGYTGPIDGVLGTNSYKNFSKFLNREL